MTTTLIHRFLAVTERHARKHGVPAVTYTVHCKCGAKVKGATRAAALAAFELHEAGAA